MALGQIVAYMWWCAACEVVHCTVEVIAIDILGYWRSSPLDDPQVPYTWKASPHFIALSFGGELFASQFAPMTKHHCLDLCRRMFVVWWSGCVCLCPALRIGVEVFVV